MWALEKIVKFLKYRILKSEEELDYKHSILSWEMDSYQNRDLHSEVKKDGFNLFTQWSIHL